MIPFGRPSYYVAHCLFEHLDCKSLWRRKVTKMGTCIEFDPSLAVNQYNKSLEQELVKDMAFEVGDNQLRYNHLISSMTHQWAITELTLAFQNSCHADRFELIRFHIWLEWIHQWTYFILLTLYWYGTRRNSFHSHHSRSLLLYFFHRFLRYVLGLTPIAFLQNIQKTYLGQPYTPCIETNG